MNFFGHLAVARQVDDHPAFLLGAMAPDLLAMCGAVAGAATSDKVADGQAHHEAVDARFHGSPAFTALASWAARSLIDAGVSRGAARGAAHVGIELFLDGELAADTAARAAYDRSLAAADAETPFSWNDRRSRDRWCAMLTRLRSSAIPRGYGDPDFVGARIAGALSRRPRLALRGVDAAILYSFLPALQRRVAAEAPALVEYVNVHVHERATAPVHVLVNVG